jgi:AraC-like DNA-binding protein
MRPSPPEKRPEGFPGQRLVIIPPTIAVEASRKPVTRDLSVTHIGTFEATGDHYVERPHGTSQHILIACISGKGSCSLAGREWSIGSGDLLFLPPREHHIYRANPRSPWMIFWIHFRGQRSQDYLDTLGITSHNPVIHAANATPLLEAFEDTYRHTQHGFSDASMIGLTTAFCRLLGLAKTQQRSAGKRSLKAEGRLAKTLSAIRDQPSHPWNLSEMAATAGMSIPHFSELCRKQTGMPPNTYLIRLRLQRAMELLVQERRNVAETALAVGYDDPFYFSRLFRKHMGMPPSAVAKGP